MNSLKSIVATMTLLAIGYGANFFMNQPVSEPESEEPWGMIGQLAPDRIPNRPQIDLPALQPAGGVVPASADTNSGANLGGRVANPFAVSAEPVLADNGFPAADNSFASLPPVNGVSNQSPSVSLPVPPAIAEVGSNALPQIPQPFPANVPPPLSSPPASIVPQQNSVYGSPANTTPGGYAETSISPPAAFVPPAAADLTPVSVPANTATAGLATAPAMAPLSSPQPIVPPVSQFDGPGVQQATYVQPQSNVDFDRLWNSAQANLTAGDLEGASTVLTRLYRQTLSSQDRDRVVTILDQLAGTAIYSSEHFLLPAHVVAANETLDTVAQSYGIPTQFLARSNGLTPTATLAAGQQLKVVKGPFHAELNLARREMTIFLGPHYAGRFNVAIGRDFPQGVSSFAVTEKTGSRAYQDLRTGQSIAAGDPGNPIGAYWLGLQPQPAVNAVNLGIHSVGDRVTASDSRGCISVSQAAAADLQAILSVGSQIMVTGSPQ